MWFEFRLTGSGWAEAEIGDEASHTNLTASYLSDALGDYSCTRFGAWSRVTRRLAAPGRRNPGEFRWTFRRNGDRVSLRLLQFDDAYEHRPDDAGRLIFETQQDTAVLARAIALGASQTLERYGEQGYEDLWGRFPFPTHILGQIQGGVQRSDD